MLYILFGQIHRAIMSVLKMSAFLLKCFEYLGYITWTMAAIECHTI